MVKQLRVAPNFLFNILINRDKYFYVYKNIRQVTRLFQHMLLYIIVNPYDSNSKLLNLLYSPIGCL